MFFNNGLLFVKLFFNISSISFLKLFRIINESEFETFINTTFMNCQHSAHKSILNSIIDIIKNVVLIWFDLSHTPIWHQPEVGPCGRTIETIKELNEKKILKPSPKTKNLFSRQKQCDVTTLFYHFNTNESYNSCSHRKKKTKQNQKNKIKFISIESSLISVSF